MWGSLLAGLSRLVSTRIGHWALALLAFLGIQFVAQEFVVDNLLQQIQSAFAGAPGEIIAWLGHLNVDRYITMILSAYVAAAATGALKMKKKPT